MAAQATMIALSVKQVAQIAVTKPTSLSFFLLPRLSIGNLQQDKLLVKLAYYYV